MLSWSSAPFLRVALAFIAGVAGYLYLGQDWAGSAAPWAAGLVLAYVLGWVWSRRRASPATTDAVGIVGLLAVAALGFARSQAVTESRRPDHIGHLAPRIEFYQATVDEAPVVRANTFATTVRVRAVRVGGRWQRAGGGIRISLPRHETADSVPAPRYGDVWLVQGRPELSKGPANLGEFDYRRYLQTHQVYHAQFVHTGQYKVLGYAPLNWAVALSQRTAAVLDGVLRRYVPSHREYALGTALVLGFKDDIDHDTRQAYANTGTTHIMAVSGLQVGLLFAALQWLLARVPLGGAVLRRRLLTAGLGLALIWSYALLTGLSASVLRATVMFTLVIIGQAWERQSSLFNTLSAAAFGLLLWNPYLLCDVGFQLSFLAVLSIVYLQPAIVGWLDVRNAVLDRRRSWHAPAAQKAWRAAAWLADASWQLTALSLAAQVATFPLGLYYFHQFPFNFLLSNLIAVPISSLAVYVGVVLLLAKGLVALIGLALPAAASAVLDYLPRAVGYLFEGLIWLFNEYIFLIGRLLPGAVIGNIHLSQAQTLLVFLLIGAFCVFVASKRLAWAGWCVALLALYAGSRVAEARAVAPLREFVVYSIPRRSVVGFWQGAAPEFVTADSLPLSETERTYRLRPSLILRRVRAPRYCVGWRGASVPASQVAPPDSLEQTFRYPPAPLVLARWRGLRLAFVSGSLRRLASPAPAQRADIIVLRRNAYLYPDALAAHFGAGAQVVFDSSCQRWYVARHDSALRAAGFRTWDVNEQGAFTYQLPAGR
ncbi:ComEC/Rec2 family competence protein [Hymenobacter cheonanensis]|uniref:ComEC/Rec2 family competence protein n=1 Tax=Hymenobacter sp. CA2-7 TaxID=3063993 RepID=UPI0027124709|nr:ComEC/Rec2 family competence protein [Hymenobacter sp. CA2-7]MDO7885725.1 ComEC/Rec2 family competence protein [Hymenobacter sp. CA2-7]